MFIPARIRVLMLMASDAVCLATVWGAAVLGYWALGFGDYDPRWYLGFWPVPVGFVVCNAVAGLYHRNWMYPAAPLPPVEELRRLFGTSLLTHLGVLAFLAFAFQTTQGYSRFVIAVSGVIVAFVAQSFRNWVRALLKRIGIGQIRVILTGNGKAVERVENLLASDRYTGFEVVARVGDPRQIVATAKRLDVKILVACLDERVIRCMMDEFSAWFTYIEYLPSAEAFPIFDAKAVSFGGVGGIEMVNYRRMRIKRLQKRIIDTLLSAFIFVLSAPLFIVIPLLIKLTSAGPVFYRAERLGRGGRRIRVWKFRSMYSDADRRLESQLATRPELAKEYADSFKLRDDPRVTPFGRFLRRTSIDELPQIFNVFCGEMALIGPRPIVEAEIPYYGPDYAVFSSVKPGITGLWQVSGRSDTDYSSRVALDVYYVMNWSMWMDIWICIRTVYAVLFMRGAR